MSEICNNTCVLGMLLGTELGWRETGGALVAS